MSSEPDHQPIVPISCREYCPIGRYVEPEDNGNDNDKEDVPSGIPHEVLGPDGEWMSLDHWGWAVADNWRRADLDGPPAPAAGSPLAGSPPGEVSFRQVVNYRAVRHRQCAETTEANLELQLAALRQADHVARHILVLESLGVGEPWPHHSDELLGWLESDVVQTPWAGYRRGYAYLGAHTQNPLWSRVQWCLAGSNRERGHSDWERLGFGDWMRPIDKSAWTHEEHACRFILHFYDLLTNPELPREHTLRGDLVENHRVGQRIAETYDERDKAWFGYSLLCLLIRSWQYKQHNAQELWVPDERLVPALYPTYFVDNYMEYPPIQIGQVNLSPFTPWICGDDMPKNLEYDLVEEDDGGELLDLSGKS